MIRRFQQMQTEERVALAAMKLQGLSPRSIASAFGAHPSTLSRELARNCSGGANVRVLQHHQYVGVTP